MREYTEILLKAQRVVNTASTPEQCAAATQYVNLAIKYLKLVPFIEARRLYARKLVENPKWKAFKMLRVKAMSKDPRWNEIVEKRYASN